jgi:hypothetical protein
MDGRAERSAIAVIGLSDCRRQCLEASPVTKLDYRDASTT